VTQRSVPERGEQDPTRELRDCRSCYGTGHVVEDVEVSGGVYEAVSAICFICKGSGTVSVYLYPRKG
jgi:DnaJ-class molecular chaperone